jgi:hypothetical protein
MRFERATLKKHDSDIALEQRRGYRNTSRAPTDDAEIGFQCAGVRHRASIEEH